MGKMVSSDDSAAETMEGTILDGKTLQEISFDELIERLSAVRIVYIGETHTRMEDHRIQLRLLKALGDRLPNLCLGVEMIDTSYQSVLEAWVQSGDRDSRWFLEKTHWYANWRFPFDLYADIFLFARERRIPTYGLNLPFHIPAKIAIGGIDSLMAADAAFLPPIIDLNIDRHKAYIRDIYEKHHSKAAPNRDNFEFFYMAQCAWEDTMAESISRHVGQHHTMIVLVGNGHIVHKFGVPDRAFTRTGLPFATVYLTTDEDRIEPDIADVIWKTSRTGDSRLPPRNHQEPSQEKP